MNRLPETPTTEISELLAGYALGALDPDERDFIARNLPRHPAWQAELDGYLAVATTLAYQPEPQDVPLRVRASVLAAVDAIESDIPLSQYRKAAWNSTLPARAMLDEPVERRSFRRTIPKLILATSMPATVVAIIFAMYTVIIHDQFETKQDEFALFQNVQDESAEVLAGDAISRDVIDLISSSDAPFARGSLFIDRAENAAVLVARDLPAIDASQQYVVWVQTNDTSQEFAQIGALNPNSAGTAQLVIDPPDVFERYLNVLVTREPAGQDIYAPSGPSILSAGF